MVILVNKPSFSSSLGSLINTLGESYQQGRQQKAERDLAEQRLKTQRDIAEQKIRSQQELAGQRFQSQQQGAADKDMRRQVFGQLAAIASQDTNQDQRGAVIQAAVQAGLDPQSITNLEKIYSGRAKEDLARQSLQQRQEAPERKMVVEQADQLIKRIPTADKAIEDFKSLKKLAQSGKLRTGGKRQLFKLFGAEDFLQGPASDVAEKLIGDITAQSMMNVSQTGQITDQKLKQIQKTNPSLLSTDNGIIAMSDMRIIGEEIAKQPGIELQKLKKQYGAKALPLNAVDLAYENAQPKIEKLHERQQRLVDSLSETAAKFAPGSIVEDQPDPRMVKRYRDPESGIIYVSDGKQFKPSFGG